MTVTADGALAYKKIRLSNGHEVAYIDEGKGDKTLVFIHGLATYSLSWKKNIEYLKNYYRCIAIDLPGNGYSDRYDQDYSINFFAGAVYDFMMQLQLTNIYLVGHSMGGQIAMTLLINQPECAKGLILCAPAGFEQFSEFEKSMYHNTIKLLDNFSTDENSLKKTIRSSFYNYPPQADEMVNDLVAILKNHSVKSYRKMIDGCIAGMLREPVFNELDQIQQPTLIMYGERDALIPNKMIHPTTTRQIAEEGIRKMPHATLEMVPQCGHFLQWERADVVNRLIKEFVE